jgi:hypothetical protein
MPYTGTAVQTNTPFTVQMLLLTRCEKRRFLFPFFSCVLRASSVRQTKIGMVLSDCTTSELPSMRHMKRPIKKRTQPRMVYTRLYTKERTGPRVRARAGDYMPSATNPTCMRMQRDVQRAKRARRSRPRHVASPTTPSLGKGTVTVKGALVPSGCLPAAALPSRFPPAVRCTADL